VTHFRQISQLFTYISLDMSNTSLDEIIHEGWLTKSPPSKPIWRAVRTASSIFRIYKDKGTRFVWRYKTKPFQSIKRLAEVGGGYIISSVMKHTHDFLCRIKLHAERQVFLELSCAVNVRAVPHNTFISIPIYV